MRWRPARCPSCSHGRASVVGLEQQVDDAAGQFRAASETANGVSSECSPAFAVCQNSARATYGTVSIASSMDGRSCGSSTVNHCQAAQIVARRGLMTHGTLQETMNQRARRARIGSMRRRVGAPRLSSDRQAPHRPCASFVRYASQQRLTDVTDHDGCYIRACAARRAGRLCPRVVGAVERLLGTEGRTVVAAPSRSRGSC